MCHSGVSCSVSHRTRANTSETCVFRSMRAFSAHLAGPTAQRLDHYESRRVRVHAYTRTALTAPSKAQCVCTTPSQAALGTNAAHRTGDNYGGCCSAHELSSARACVRVCGRTNWVRGGVRFASFARARAGVCTAQSTARALPHTRSVTSKRAWNQWGAIGNLLDLFHGYPALPLNLWPHIHPVHHAAPLAHSHFPAHLAGREICLVLRGRDRLRESTQQARVKATRRAGGAGGDWHSRHAAPQPRAGTNRAASVGAR